ncbi:DUF6538 domain-containing protein, partial [Thermodesulfobacteriota bacterium]
MKPTTSKSPHYLVRNSYSYCFRMKVPQDLQKYVGRKELRYSLKTGYRSEARAKALMLAGIVHRIIRSLRKGGAELSELTDDQIQAMVQKYLRDWVKRLDERWLVNEAEDRFLNREMFHQYVRDLDYIKEDIVEDLALCDYHRTEKTADVLLEKNDVVGLEKESRNYRKLCRELLKIQLQELEIEKKQMLGDYSDSYSATVNGQLSAGSREAANEPEGELISEMIERHAAETGVNWTPKTKEENLSILRLFVEVAGNVPIQSITRKNVAEFKQTLMKLPPNRNKSLQYRNKSIPEILKMEVTNTMSNTTVGKYLTRISALFEYARRHGIYKGENPATRMNPPTDKLPNEARAPYDEDELTKILCSEEYLKDEHKYSYQFWAPILALFTGARENELAQLHLSDIREAKDSAWVLDLNKAEEKGLKTRSSKRIIPIHHFLLEDLNFLSYVEALKAKGEQRLFPELKKSRDGYGRNVSRWFNESYKKKCGIESTDGRKRDFHSFRTTFINQLVRLKVHDRMRLQVSGHSAGKDMTSVYADPFPAKQVRDEVISKLDYGIDLSHLKNSRFVIK